MRCYCQSCSGTLAALVILVAPILTGADNPKPPVALVRNVVDEYYGRKVDDPYRYMEKLDDPEVAAWFKAQAAFTDFTLEAIPGRAALLARIEQLDASTPAVVREVERGPGDRIFYKKRLASENTFKLYIRRGFAGPERLLVDPDKFAHQPEEHMALTWWKPSNDGHYVVYGISPAGSEAAVLYITDVKTGARLPEAIDRCQFGGVAWVADSRSFVYNRLQKMQTNSVPTEKNLNRRLYLHVLGADPERDSIAFGAGVPGLLVQPTDFPTMVLASGSHYAVGVIGHGAQRTVTIYKEPIELLGKQNAWTKILDVEDEVTEVAVHGDDLYAVSQRGVSRRQLMVAHLSDTDFKRAKILIPQGRSVIEDIAAASDALYVRSADVGNGKVTRLNYDSNRLSVVPQPYAASAWRIHADVSVPGLIIGLGSWIRPDRTYAYDPISNSTADTQLEPASTSARSDFQVSEVQAKSLDGTLVPLTLISKKALRRNGQNPTLMMGYGAYGLSMDPVFDPVMQAWLEYGAIYAVAHIRGGGEYGEDWHIAGKGPRKENTWKDFIACAQYLIDQHYTTAKRLGITGGSAGGITIGRSITERPDLFAVAIDSVPASDMVRMEFSPNGPANVLEFGTVTNQEGFEGLMKMSAYHHVKDGTSYPAVLLTTGFNDPRVIAWQPGKLAARLQSATASNKPVLLRVDYNAGHGVGSTKKQHELEMGDEFSFLLWQMGIPEFQPKAGHTH